MAAIELPFSAPLLRKAAFVIAALVEMENPGVAVAVRYENGTIRSGHSGGEAPLVRRFKTRLRRSGYLQHDRAVDLELQEQPVFRRRALLHGSVEELLSVL